MYFPFTYCVRETQQVDTTRVPELRTSNAADRRRLRVARVGVTCKPELRASQRLQTELLGKFLFHLVLIKNIGENDLLVLWNIGDEILEVASNNEEVSRARSNVGNG